MLSFHCIEKCNTLHKVNVFKVICNIVSFFLKEKSRFFMVVKKRGVLCMMILAS